MEPLLVALMTVDEATGGSRMRQLADGWAGREARAMRRVRVAGARVLRAMAALLAPHPAPFAPTPGSPPVITP